MNIQVLYDLAVYLGITALIVFIFTVLTGLRVIKTKPKRHIHKKLALTAFTLVCIHGIVMIYFYFFS
ncbi:MAG: hypothetical protein STSR0006_19040 [Lentimicrobium sp.]